MASRSVARSVTVIEYPMFEAGDGSIRFCAICREAFGRGDHWRKIVRLDRDGGYAVGVHVRCLAPKGGSEAPR